MQIHQQIPLAPLTTLQLGGPARYYVRVQSETELVEALQWAHERELPIAVHGGGSNVVVADRGFDGLVIHLALGGIVDRIEGPSAELTVAAGESWDDVVAHSIARGSSGLECLSGIPGSAGATPVQNVGAYGVEVAHCLRSVRVLDRFDGTIGELGAAQCEFGYRDSRFKREPDRYIVLAVTFALSNEPPAPPRYTELVNALRSVPTPTANDIRSAVLRLRTAKSMVIRPDDPNRRSVGSFFTNPIVDLATAADVIERAKALRAPEPPQWPVGDTHVKLPAAWLIERSGIAKGLRRGAVGISSAHTLALVHHGGGTTAELIDFAAWVRERVQQTFGIRLVPEPVFVGTSMPD